MSKLNKVMKSLKEMYSHRIPEFRAELLAAQEKKERKKEKKRAELEKAHKYSRKEFINGSIRYFYDKNDNFSRMPQCMSLPLAVHPAMSQQNIINVAHNYLQNIWLADWQQHPNKAVCKELNGKKINFSNISFKHIRQAGKNSAKGIAKRDTQNLVNHVKYLPCAKELLENSGVNTQARYEVFSNPQKDGAIGLVYQTVSGLAPHGDANKYIQVTLSQKKYKDGSLGEMVYISVMGTKTIKKSFYSTASAWLDGYNVKNGEQRAACSAQRHPSQLNKSLLDASIPQTIKKSNGTKTAKLPPHTPFTVHITELTEGNRAAKFTELTKALRGEETRFIPSDGTKPLQNVTLRIKDLSPERVEKAVRTMALTLGVPLKSAKGEVFLYKAQEELTDTWCAFFSTAVQNAYDFVTAYFDLPKKTVMSKSQKLTYKGKVLYKPETGEPITQREWDRFVKTLEEFLNRNVKDADKKIVLQASSLAKILNRMLKYNTLEAITHMKLEDVTYHEKSFDWISDSVKNMSRSFGESFTRQEQARIEVIRQSAAQKITNVTDKVRADIQQILIDGVKGKKSKSAVSQELFNRMIGDNRDYQRLADTEIQNSFNNAFIREEAYNAKAGEKVYFQRIEVVDDNTCAYCKRMNGKIALWSDAPLESDISADENADYVIWEGKEWSGKEKSMTTGVFHPYCRGAWVRYEKEFRHLDALIAEKSGQAKRWNEAVKQAENEFKDKGIANPDDRTQGFRERINEIFTASGDIAKSLTYSGHKLQGRRTFAGLKISIENRKGSIRRGIDSNGHKWAIKMNYDYGYIRGTVGVDGDHVDCYLGDNEDAENVYIIRQNNPETHTYDEDKCMLGFNSLAEAKRAFLSQYDRPGFLGKIVTVRLDLFKKKIYLKKYRGKKLL